jgi:hypothetical protein
MSYSVKVTLEPAPDIERIVSEELFKAAVQTQNAWRENLQQGKGAEGDHGRPYVGTGEAINRTSLYPEHPGTDVYEIVGETVQHVIAEFGRTPGAKMPPAEPIARWAKEAGVVPRDGETWEGMIFTLRRHIAEHGLKGFAPGLLAMQTVAPTVEESIKARFKRELEEH